MFQRERRLQEHLEQDCGKGGNRKRIDRNEIPVLVEQVENREIDQDRREVTNEQLLPVRYCLC